MNAFKILALLTCIIICIASQNKFGVTSAIKSTNSGTFNASGTIDTLFYIIQNNSFVNNYSNSTSKNMNMKNMNMPMNNSMLNGSKNFNITNALNSSLKSIVDGNWNLSSIGGKVSRFVVNFSSVNADGTLPHTHQIINFKQSNSSKAILSPDLDSRINGKSDVGINGDVAWKNVDTSILISKGKAITIQLDDNQTENHFKGQPIYGTVKSLERKVG